MAGRRAAFMDIGSTSLFDRGRDESFTRPGTTPVVEDDEFIKKSLK
jgi:hypothetical protein